VSHEEGKAIIKQLKAAGAKKIPNPTYDIKKDATWYTIPGLREFGIRKTTHILSTKHGVERNIDVHQLNIGLEKIKISRKKR
jgi:hypothetical protein